MSKFISHDFKEGYHVKCMFFGVIDIIVGILIFLSSQLTITKNIFIYFSFLYFIIGFSSLGQSLYKKYFYDWRGYIDVITAFVLLGIYFGNASLLSEAGPIIILKGVLCSLIPTTKEY